MAKKKVIKKKIVKNIAVSKTAKNQKKRKQPILPTSSTFTQNIVAGLPIEKPAKSTKPEPANKLILEYIIYASPKLLFEFITTPSGLSEWFADDVNIQNNVYSFFWDGAKQEADILAIEEGKSIRLRWTDRPADTYFEFKIEKNELTHELSLVITDFAESFDEVNSLEVLWQGQIQRLAKIIGSKA